MKFKIDKTAFTIAEQENGSIQEFISDNMWISKADIAAAFNGLCNGRVVDIISYGNMIVTKDHYKPAIAVEDAVIIDHYADKLYYIGYMNISRAIEGEYSASVIEYSNRALKIVTAD